MRRFLPAKLSRFVILSGVAPALLRWPSQARILRTLGAADQLKTIAIHWLPIWLIDLKGHMLLVGSGIDHNCPATLGKASDTEPQPLADASRDMPDKDAWRNLQQPPGQVSP